MLLTQTQRLRIREFTLNEKDVQFVLTILNTPGWLQFIGDRNIRTKEQAREYIQIKFLDNYSNRHYNMYAMDLKETGVTVGMCGLVRRDYLEHTDIGYALLPEYFGQGYASEAAAAMVTYANDVLKEETLLAVVTPDNKSSKAVLQKLHFDFVQEIINENETLHVYMNVCNNMR
jgi:[ribosomal protein S5]-alanine N-acetyltransferase